MKPIKAVIILKALLLGTKVERNGLSYFLSDDLYLCQETTYGAKECSGKNNIEKTGVKIDFGGFALHDFLNWCEQFTKEEVFIISANYTLNNQPNKE